jgi:hypothetical protein
METAMTDRAARPPRIRLDVIGAPMLVALRA